MTTQLQDLVILSPEISGSVISIEAEVLGLLIQAETGVDVLDVTFNNVLTTYSTFTVVGSNKQFPVTIALPTKFDLYSLIIRGRNTGSTAFTGTLQYDVLLTSDPTSARALPPTGVSVFRKKDSCKIQWVTPAYSGFLGVRVAQSTDSTGIDVPFTSVGNLIAAISSDDKQVTSTATEVIEDDLLGTRITTTTENIVDVKYSSVELLPDPNGTVDTFYVVLSTLIQDPDTKHIYESRFNGPFKAGFVDLRRVNLTDFLALQDQNDIASRMISNILTTNPDIDLSARSELRDLIIDPVAIEFSNASIREWFNRFSCSISALDEFDDNDGDGISDPLESSSLKQSVQVAFGIAPDNFQSFVDIQFDVLGEQAGVSRLPATTSKGSILIYSLTKPTQRQEVLLGGLVGTVRDSETPAVTFILRGSTVIDPAIADTYFNADTNRWEIAIPIEAQNAGSIGNVGAGAIKRVIAGIPSGWQVTNNSATDFGFDTETNSNYAARISDKQVVGVDTGSKLGLLNIARSTPGVVSATVVASGESEMLRDWDPTRQKHVFGTVDVYVRGVNKSESENLIPFRYQSSSIYNSFPTYPLLDFISLSDLKLKLRNPENFAYLPYSPVEIFVDKGGPTSFYFGLTNATVDGNGFITLSPTDVPYRIINGEPTPLTSTNSAIAPQSQGATIRGFVRLYSGVDFTPTQQPVSGVTTIAGETSLTGIINPKNFRIVRTSDPLLLGNSNEASDKIVVDQYSVFKEAVIQFVTAGPDTVNVDEGILLSDSGDFIIVRNGVDNSIKYNLGEHYSIVPYGRYNKYAIKRLATATTPIPLDTDIRISYNQEAFLERVLLVTGETHALSTTPTSFTKSGFIYNTWLPESHDALNIINDMDMSIVSRSNRYIKVTYDTGFGPVVMIENKDFKLIVNEKVGSAQILRIVGPGSRIPDGGVATINYFRNEMFDIRSTFPAYVDIVAAEIDKVRHAAADIVVKDLVENKVDLAFSVEIDSTANVEVVDNKIRTSISIVMDNTVSKLTQAELIRQIKGINGVKNVIIPFRQFAKSDGDYEVGHVIPTGTSWVKTSEDGVTKTFNFPADSWITESSVLPYKTIPSGGKRDSYVGMLYGGQQFKRLYSLDAMVGQTDACFYIIGSGDTSSSENIGKIVFLPPSFITDPSLKAYKVTYQIFGETGPTDLPISSTEYLRPGNIFIDYIQD